MRKGGGEVKEGKIKRKEGNQGKRKKEERK